MRSLSTTQQRSLLENLANTSNAVMGGLLADTLRRTAQLREGDQGRREEESQGDSSYRQQ